MANRTLTFLASLGRRSSGQATGWGGGGLHLEFFEQCGSVHDWHDIVPSSNPTFASPITFHCGSGRSRLGGQRTCLRSRVRQAPPPASW